MSAYLSMSQLGVAMEELARLQHQVRLSEVNLHHEVNQCGERDLFSKHMSTGGLPLYNGQTVYVCSTMEYTIEYVHIPLWYTYVYNIGIACT